MKDISEKTGISIGLLLTLLAMLAGAGGTAVVAVYRVGALEKAAEKQEARDAEQDKRIAATELGAVGLSAQLANLNSTVSKMDAKLDRLLENRTNSAVYRQPRGPNP